MVCCASHVGCMLPDLVLCCCGLVFAAVKPHCPLLSYLDGLAEEVQLDVFSKLDAAGYAAPGREGLVETLANSDLEKMGIEPPALRSELLKAFALSGR